MTEVYLDGQFIPQDAAKVSVMDRGFLFGDAVYEVIPAYAGKPFHLEQHLQRLNHSLQGIRMASPLEPQEWSRILERLLQQAPEEDQSVYIQITRGVGTKRSHAIPVDLSPTVFAMASPLARPPKAHIEQGISAVTVEDNRWTHCDIKATALLANILLKEQATDQGANEAILVRDGNVTEGAACNLFIVKDGVIITPPNSLYLLSGITRDVVLELAKHAELPTKEENISLQQLQQADEIWVTSSAREVLAVTQLNGQAIRDGQPGPLWQRMRNLFSEHISQYYA